MNFHYTYDNENSYCCVWNAQDFHFTSSGLRVWWPTFQDLTSEVKSLDIKGKTCQNIAEIPQGVETLSCCECSLRSIQNLPHSLKFLECCENDLSELSVPHSIEEIDARWNSFMKKLTFYTPDGQLTDNPLNLRSLFLQGTDVKCLQFHAVPCCLKHVSVQMYYDGTIPPDGDFSPEIRKIILESAASVYM